jgi:hypothetical protein
MKYVIDTNVAVVANGNPEIGSGQLPSLKCRLASVNFLIEAVKNGKVFLDLNGDIVREYATYLNPIGAPGVGDQFYREVINSHPDRIIRIELVRLNNGEYADCPQILIESDFDPSDRKFAALAAKTSATVVNSVDSDWINHAEQLQAANIPINNLCGCDPKKWFE